MALTEAERLRQLLGETVPPGGDDTDTMFTSEAVDDFLDQGGGDLEAAAYYGWRAKWSELSNLVNGSTGTQRDELGNLAAEAKRQLDYYGVLSGIIVETSSTGRTRIGRIVR